eukprot:TRINITY_DN2058_c0_g1_i3.p1 TRINITY_DN2058_c0_g1~~TRINITY_DN2058_c0_g1_i3.p1  ORF type:complete len:614 (-),score=100.69 TRINITY_DN2058_c0_g1_i3:34-1875(-)
MFKIIALLVIALVFAVQGENYAIALNDLVAEGTQYFPSMGCSVFNEHCFLVSNPTLCSTVLGQISDTNCSDLSELGSCCHPNNFCMVSTEDICFFDNSVQKSWTQFEQGQTECVCDTFRQSCCLVDQCIDDLPKEECLKRGGRYATSGCESMECLYDYEGAPTGACVSVSSNGFHCGGTFVQARCLDNFFWSLNKTCEDIDMVDETKRLLSELPGPVNTTSNGRCCTIGPHACKPANSSSDCPGGWYQPGLDCMSDKNGLVCGKRGSCFRNDGDCYENDQYVCLSGGGTWKYNEYCNGQYFKKYPCYYYGVCQLKTSVLCDIYGGYLDTESVACNTTGGVCCQVHGEQLCKNYLNCPIDESYIPTNETCDTFDCSQVIHPGCCVKDVLCSPNKPIELCLEINGEPSLNGCPTSGTCDGGDLSFRSQNVDVKAVEAILTGISINSTDSVLDFGESILDNVGLNLKHTTINFALNISLKSSVVNLDTLSSVKIGGCIDISDSELVVDLSDFDFDSITEESDHTLITYECIQGNFENYVMSNVPTGYCASVSNFAQRFVLSTNICKENTDAVVGGTDAETSKGESNEQTLDENSDSVSGVQLYLACIVLLLTIVFI